MFSLLNFVDKPLKDLGLEGSLDIETEGEEEEGDHSVENTLAMTPNTREKISRRHISWVICSATAIYTSKALMVNNGFHYPITIVFRIFVASFIIYSFMTLRRSFEKCSNEAFDNITRPGHLIPNVSWTSMITASIVAAVWLPMLLEGILHMPSLPALVMLFPLVYATESLILFICCQSYRRSKEILWHAFTVVSACTVILYNENRLMVPGLICGITSMLLLGIARACFVLGSERGDSNTPTEEMNHAFVTMTLVCGTIFSGVMAYHFEDSHSVWTLEYTTFVVMALNMAAMIGAVVSGASVMVFSAFPLDGGSVNFQDWPDQISGLMDSIISNALLLIIAIISSPHPYVRWIQIAAYLVANISLISLDQLYSITLTLLSYVVDLGQGTAKAKHQPGKCITSFFIAILIITTSFFVSFLSSTSINALPEGPQATYDHSYQPPSRFDIVVSMYDESPSSVKHMLNQITSTAFLQHLSSENQKPRIIIYTKNPTIDLETLQGDTSADIVERLENYGREGGTYLSHIVNKWDSLAEQTMFLQAHAHNIRELIPRINDYLVKDTGMLSLGFSGVTCPCGRCGDRWSWEDEKGVVPEVYNQVYGVECKKEQPILLSYKGQFVASARRIRGVRRKVYVDLLDRTTRIENHKEMEGVMEEDDWSNPRFGFTMERLWGLVMQCATNERVASRCPSLLSGVGWEGSMEDCQCLD